MSTREEILRGLASRIAAIRPPHPVRVAIDGIDAAGKTTLADELAPAIERHGRPVIRASIDGFHNPRDARYRRGSLSPEGYFHDSFNYPALIEALLQPLGPGGSLEFRRRAFDFRTDAPVAAPSESAPADAVLLLDGVFLLRRELRDYFDFSIFVRVDVAESLRRGQARDAGLFGGADEARRRYEERYIPGQQAYLATEAPERWASVILDNNDVAQPVIDRAG